MILKIKYNEQEIIIHCTEFSIKKRSYHISGASDDVKNAIDALGLKYGTHVYTGSLCIFKQKTLLITEAQPRTNVECKISELAVGEVFLPVIDARMYTYTGQNKAHFIPALGKEIVEFNPDDIVKPCMNVPTKQLKVRLYRIDRDRVMEIWQSEPVPTANPQINSRLYLGRDIADGGWCFLSDAPGGYCEPSHHIGPHLNLTVCDNKWEELFQSGNNRLLYPEGFPTLKKVAQTEWESIKDKYPNLQSDGVQAWLDTFRPEKLEYPDSINWDHNRYKNIDPDNILEDSHMVTHEIDSDFKTQIIHTFLWLNEPYHIIRYAQRHTMCDARWYEYMVVSMDKGKVEDNIHWLAYQLNVKEKK